jgi:hypothetical protein
LHAIFGVGADPVDVEAESCERRFSPSRTGSKA